MLQNWPQWLLLFALIVRLVALLIGSFAGQKHYSVSIYSQLSYTFFIAWCVWAGGFFERIFP